MPVPKYVTLEHAADRLGVNTRTIRRRIAEGKLPAYRLGPRQIRVWTSDVDALLVRIPAADGVA